MNILKTKNSLIPETFGFPQPDILPPRNLLLILFFFVQAILSSVWDLFRSSSEALWHSCSSSFPTGNYYLHVIQHTCLVSFTMCQVLHLFVIKERLLHVCSGSVNIFSPNCVWMVIWNYYFWPVHCLCLLWESPVYTYQSVSIYYQTRLCSFCSL